MISATLGDGFSYWLGHRHHEALRSWWPLNAHPDLLARGQAYFAAHEGKSVFLGRFLGPVPAIAPMVAGMSDMPVLRFTVVNVLSAVAWSAISCRWPRAALRSTTWPDLAVSRTMRRRHSVELAVVPLAPAA